MKLIHISDLHIDASSNKFDLGRYDNIIDVIIHNNYPEGTVIVMTGDLVNKGLVSPLGKEKNPAYQGVKKLEANGYNNRVLVIPGNHDYGVGVDILDSGDPTVLIDDFKSTFYDDVTSTYPRITQIDNFVFIGLDSTAPALHDISTKYTCTSQGEIGETQMKSVSKSLNEAKKSEKKTIVYLHHHPFSTNDKFKLNDAKEFITQINSLTDVLLFGHIHHEVNNGDDGSDDNQIPRIYNAGSSTNMDNFPDSEWTSHYRVIDLDKDPENDTIVIIPIYKLTLDNSHGGTYIAHGKLTYTVNGEAREQKNTASGGLTSTIEVPVLAKDIQYVLTFEASDTKITFKWADISFWDANKCEYFDIKGVYPGAISVKERNADVQYCKLELNNKHGGTYIAHGVLTYMFGGSNQVVSNVASGGTKSTIELPSNATDIEYSLRFDASKTKKELNWADGWTGNRHIDIKGVWPGKITVTDNGIS